MGCIIAADTPCAKGPIPYYLDLCSKGADARERLMALNDAIRAIGPNYEGLADVFDRHLMAVMGADSRMRERVRDHLARFWFSEDRDPYFPGQRVTEKYAQAVLKTIELSLNGVGDPVPIDAWWVMHSDKEVKMLNLAELDDDGNTVSMNVTLLIMTPRPNSTSHAPVRTPILGDANAWLTEYRGESVITRPIDQNLKNRPRLNPALNVKELAF
jgi:hypothetical protein